MKQPVAASALAGPSRAVPFTTTLKTKATNFGIGGLPGGVVGPEAAGLDPSGPEHFFVTLAAYADALDALPLDLTRSFSDLRELDAVLGSHLNSLTARLNHLTALIEDPDVDQGQRLLALKEVAEEARAYKMGGEDKIRVALNTAETIISHTDYIEALDAQFDRFPEISALLNPTKHLKLEQYYVPGSLKDRKLISTLEAHTTAAGSAAVETNGAGGSKKKKIAANVAAANAAGAKSHKAAAETASVAGSAAGTGTGSNSKKRKTISGGIVANSTSASSKVAKTSASGKGDEDVKAAANGSISHKKKTDTHSSAAVKSNAANSNTRLPRAAHVHSGYTEDDEEGGLGGRKDASTSRRGGGSGAGAGAGDAEESASRSRSRAIRNTATAQRSDDEDDDLDDADPDDEVEPATSRSNNNSNSNNNNNSNSNSNNNNNSKSRSRANRNATSNSRGRGGTAAAAASPHTGSNSASRADSPASNVGGGDDADEERYCFCNNYSYGDMIACDDDDCEIEWFHLGCVGLTKPPINQWYCEACLERRASNGRGGKGKKAKSGGAKSKVRR
ncbi:related to p33ING1b (ING1) protein [Melanopsichium pennsylvanicum]|uniref:Chromatin modification-related protein n=2 Tax=Melanopsichium pennsylvanicum TaxID=63383 RepID=A0AAJ4XI69_9BASI|nr:related to p33ING1b (ING1) protein [Melanopsichium pennsylvanicum]